MKQGNRVGKAAVKFTSGCLAGFHLVGFTICVDDSDKGMFVLFPAATSERPAGGRDTDSNERKRQYFFLRPDDPTLLDRLEDEIINAYKAAVGFNTPRVAS